MVARVKKCPLAGRPRIAALALAVGLLASVCGCGSTPAARVAAAVTPQPADAPSACSAAVLDTLSSVVQRVYLEGVHGERIGSAEYLIEHSQALRTAVETGNRTLARAAAHALLATGHLTDLSITRGGQSFLEVGGAALAPLHGTLVGAAGAPIGSYLASVWADNGFLIEARGISQGLVALRAGTATVAGSPALGSGTVPDVGAATFEHAAYSYTSFPAEAYPSGALRVYLLIPARMSASLCGRTREDTVVNTLRSVAHLIYAGESGQSAQKQVRRVQRNQALLQAVANREPAATEAAIKTLLNQHIVRMRVSAGGQLLSDVGGPYVLAPIDAALRLHGHTVGSVVLSIQDDEGYLRLTRRLAGLDVLMYMNTGPGAPQLVKDSLGPAPGPPLASVPASGSYRYRGHTYRVFTVRAEAFPSGPLTVRVLVPIPYL
ncbi:MAG TPA: hypothetical protein VK790_02955 [Solirubrobacteraceae bacterium]|jgi:hypothetical protein|nr:hypothetical protein [Solirubrobacteraceae bacterium]